MKGLRGDNPPRSPLHSGDIVRSGIEGRERHVNSVHGDEISYRALTRWPGYEEHTERLFATDMAAMVRKYGWRRLGAGRGWLMANPAVMEVPRFERRRLLATEASCRKSGDWGAWETIDYPDGVFSGRGWLRDVRQVRKNKVFCVLIRPHQHGVHLAVSSLSGVRPGWREMQRIKNDILGDEATAVEVYPPSSQVVDEADMFHIWSTDPLPFGIWKTAQR